MAIDLEAAAKLHAYLEGQGIPCRTVRQAGATLQPVCRDPAQQAQADAIAAAWSTELPELRPEAEVAADLATEIKPADAPVLLAKLLARMESREPGLLAALGLKTKGEKKKE